LASGKRKLKGPAPAAPVPNHSQTYQEIYLKEIASLETQGGWTATMAIKMKTGDTIIIEKLDELPTSRYLDGLIAS
jgi:hypothetical protein